MRKSESKCAFIFGAIPHSILRRTKQIKNPTASALLLLLAERTFAFRKGFVDLTFRKLAEELNVSWRTIATAARRLHEQGDLTRQRLPGGAYRWWLPIERAEIIADPESRFHVKDSPEPPTPPHDRSIISPHDRSDMTPMIDRSWDRMFDKGHSERDITRLEACANSVDKSELKKDLKKTDLKKQQQPYGQLYEEARVSKAKVSVPEPAVDKTDDEPLHKFCLKGLKEHGVSQRVARQLCRKHDHETIRLLLETVPALPGIKNLAGYLVSAIKDGGYETITSRPGAPAQTGQDKKNASQVTGRRSNYAHLTNHNVKSGRHSFVKPGSHPPIVYKTVEETRAENEALIAERAEREQSYQMDSQTLKDRFKNLSGDLKAHLKDSAAAYLETLVPMSAKREKMLQDLTFQRLANRTVLERFFGWLDLGLEENQALERLAIC